VYEKLEIALRAAAGFRDDTSKMVDVETAKENKTVVYAVSKRAFGVLLFSFRCTCNSLSKLRVTILL